MTEEHWLRGGARYLIRWLLDNPVVTYRKAQLLRAAAWQYLADREGKLDAEACARGCERAAERTLAPEDAREQAPRAWRECYLLTDNLLRGEPARTFTRAVVYDIFGNPFRPIAFDPAWRTSDVTALATGVYEARTFDQLPILADALQDAGCESADLLNHLRDPDAAHVRGCWALDLVLGKE